MPPLLTTALFLDASHAQGAQHERRRSHKHHVALHRAYHREQRTAARRSDDLRYADSAVEESEVSALVSVALKSVRDEGERHGEHRSPCATDEHERQSEQVLVVHERHESEANGADDKAQRVSRLLVLEARQSHCPQYRADSLPAEHHANPVACLLIALRCGVGGVPYGVGDGAVGVCPHEHECCPAEELHGAHLPEHRRRVAQQLNPVGFAFVRLGLRLVVLGVLLRVPLLHLQCGVDDAEDEYSGADVERIDYGVGYDALLSLVGYADGCEEIGEEVAHDRSGVAEERLYGVGERLLLLVNHVAHEHLERLHRHVDARVEEHQRDEAEHHCRADRHAERTGVWQQAHHGYSHRCADEEIGNAASEATPCAVAECADDGLHEDAHERWQYPEVAEAMRVGTKCGEDARDVSALQGVRNLYAEESETEVPQFPET